MNKYEKHTGIIEFKLGEDVFFMQPSIKDWVKMFKVWEGEDPKSKKDFSEEEVNSLITVISSAIKRADPETDLKVINTFVENNFYSCMEAFTKMLEEDKQLKDFIEKQKGKLNGTNNNKTT